MIHVLFDSVNAGAIPTGAAAPAATAGYVDGWYNNSAAMRAMFPNIPHVAIAVFAKDNADALDCEPGDATIYEAPGWADRQYQRGVALPIIYTSASNIAELRRVMGGRNFLLWSAHYTGNPHLCGSGCGYPGADATQFWDHGTHGENIDQTVMSDAFFAAIGGASSLPSPDSPAPVPATPPVVPPPLTGDNDMLGYLYRRASDGKVVFISGNGVNYVPDTGHLKNLTDLGFGYGPKQGGLDPTSVWFAAADGPFQALIDSFGGLK